jgi:ABC-type antimicrobial peptide transport system permease subunit
MTIVGVIADVHETGFASPRKPGLYVLASQVGFASDNLVVRVAGNPLLTAPAIARVIAEVDPDQPVAAVRSMDQIVGLAAVDRRQPTIVFTSFALVATLLAAIGLYGLVAYTVTQHRREIGLRMALGATAARVARPIVQRSAVTLAVGLAVGVAGSLAGTPMLRALLYDVDAHDPATLAGVVLVLIVVAGIACWLPLRRVTDLEPTAALRQD